MEPAFNITLLVLCYLIIAVSCDLGFMHMSNSVNNVMVEECSDYNPSFSPYPIELDNKTRGKHVQDIYPDSGCTDPKDPSLYKGKIIMMMRHPNCTFANRARAAQKAGGAGILVVSDTGLISPGANDTDFEEINITVSIITNGSYNKFRTMMEVAGIDNVYVQLYAPEPHYYDPNSFIMWFIAIFTCALGGWLQGSSYASQTADRSKAPKPSGGKNEEGGDEMHVTVSHAVVFFGMCSISILLMYFFYNYLVYVIIGIFCFASCISSFDFLYSIFRTSACFTRHRIPPNHIPFLRTRPPIFGVVLFLFCAGFAVFWAVNRKEPYAWILQDFLGFTFCIHMIKQIRLPSFKVSSLLLVLFFIYDIFYVFVTPLLTKNKESIMVQVATGGSGATEELPMLFKLPRFLFSPYSKCAPVPYSMLGYGDVILPGLHVGFCAVWDFRISNTVRRHAYFIASVIGYATGLILTFVGMYIMMMGQPALLYLTPCCLISTLTVALKRKELRSIWNGNVPVKSTQTGSNVDVPQSEQESLLGKQDA